MRETPIEMLEEQRKRYRMYWEWAKESLEKKDFSMSTKEYYEQRVKECKAAYDHFSSAIEILRYHDKQIIG